MQKFLLTAFAVALSVAGGQAQYTFPVYNPSSPVVQTWQSFDLTTLGTPTAGTYVSATVLVNWVAGGGDPWSVEARLTFSDVAGTGALTYPTPPAPTYTGGSAYSNVTAASNALNSGNPVPNLSFSAGFTTNYTSGPLFLNIGQTFGGSDASWSSISVTLNAAAPPPAGSSPALAIPISYAPSSTTVSMPGGFNPIQWRTFVYGGGQLQVDTIGSLGGVDTEIGLYTAAGNLVTNDDDAAGNALSKITVGDATGFPMVVGDTYYLAVGFYQMNFGNTAFNVIGGTATAADVQVNLSIVPEPASMGLLSMIGFGMVRALRRRAYSSSTTFES
ncbi:hypothetical protein BH11PLA2_BH11PLA2_05420 [soil metagenome]